MKYLKSVENYIDKFVDNYYLKSNFIIGEYVIVTRAYQSNENYSIKIKNGDRCKIIDYGMSSQYVIIEREDGVKEEYRKNRITPEVEYNANKYNL